MGMGAAPLDGGGWMHHLPLPPVLAGPGEDGELGYTVARVVDHVRMTPDLQQALANAIGRVMQRLGLGLGLGWG